MKKRNGGTIAPPPRFVLAPLATVTRGGPGAPRLFLLGCHKTESRWRGPPHRMEQRPRGAGGQPALLRIVAVGWLVPLAALVFCPLVPVEEVMAHPPSGSPRYGSGLPLFTCGEEELPPLIYHQKKGANVWGDYKTFFKYFLMASTPALTDAWTVLLCTP